MQNSFENAEWKAEWRTEGSRQQGHGGTRREIFWGCDVTFGGLIWGKNEKAMCATMKNWSDGAKMTL